VRAKNSSSLLRLIASATTTRPEASTPCTLKDVLGQIEADGRDRRQISDRLSHGRRLYGDLFVKPSRLPISSVSNSRLLRSIHSEDPRGARRRGQHLRRVLVSRLDPCWIPTMKQPFASAARLRGDGPILLAASEPTVRPGHRHLGSSTGHSGKSERTPNCLFEFLVTGSGRLPQTRSRPGFRRP